MTPAICSSKTTVIDWRAMETAPKTWRYVLLLCHSGYVTIDDVIVTGRYNDSKRRWEGHDNDALMDSGLNPRAWAPLPLGHK